MRCPWADSSKEMQDYHDNEWGKVSHDERYFFEMLTLEGAQAGLSWATIIKRRKTYKIAYDNFDIKKIANYDQAKRDALLEDKGIIRNRLKVDASIKNAKLIQDMHLRGEKFSDYIWNFVDNKPIINHYSSQSEMPAQTELSQKISRDLKKRDFKFVGPTIVYSFLQAVGVINDHLESCDFK
ncbi:DNA-3-methyladenine glycosylase I [Companilactobacillus halodurans]|uniref:DNA-3-methyladenine glycosylase I n=1 Tax=Companilactobacillus halodurans TaxID=2584183 RepID=A0A5P0ZP94_9LACO|nr:DNA-3-methyladenine glycosylase I [Companilactobacillus halodurans]MQS76026.1 DNA-3-methyladenine glycosylase I [Companilactobacillus halodurans]MQS96462.1 DNA-3-methyladenine glycosylase I [Companilactobacillus halodurans]